MLRNCGQLCAVGSFPKCMEKEQVTKPLSSWTGGPPVHAGFFKWQNVKGML